MVKLTFEAGTAHNVAHHRDCVRRLSREDKNSRRPEVSSSSRRLPRGLTAKYETFEEYAAGCSQH